MGFFVVDDGVEFLNVNNISYGSRDLNVIHATCRYSCTIGSREGSRDCLLYTSDAADE